MSTLIEHSLYWRNGKEKSVCRRLARSAKNQGCIKSSTIFSIQKRLRWCKGNNFHHAASVIQKLLTGPIGERNTTLATDSRSTLNLQKPFAWWAYNEHAEGSRPGGGSIQVRGRPFAFVLRNRRAHDFGDFGHRAVDGTPVGTDRLTKGGMSPENSACATQRKRGAIYGSSVPRKTVQRHRWEGKTLLG